MSAGGFPLSGFRNSIATDLIASASTATLFSTAFPLNRSGLNIAACSTGTIYVKFVKKGAAAPTITSSNWHWAIPPGSTDFLPFDTSSDMYYICTTVFNVLEVQY